MAFIKPDNKKWIEVLNKIPYEFYHHPDYVELESNLVEGKPVAWYAEDENDWILIPLIKRRISEEITNGKIYFDLVSPYGYPGILTNSGEKTRKFLNQFTEEAKKKKIISTFIRLNPFLNRYIFDETDDIRQVIHGQVVSIDMSVEYKKRYKLYFSQSRRYIKLLKKDNFTVNWGGWEKLEDFIQIYNDTMDRQDAEEYYYFPKEYYLKLKKLNEKGLDVELLLCENETGEVVAGSIFCNNGKYMQYHLSATHNDYVSQSPISLIFDEIFQKYSAKLTYLNLGGGVGNEKDSLFKFKERFGKEYLKFSTLRIVNDRQRYNNLCADYDKDGFSDLSGYFPLYRK